MFPNTSNLSPKSFQSRGSVNSLSQIVRMEKKFSIYRIWISEYSSCDTNSTPNSGRSHRILPHQSRSHQFTGIFPSDRGIYTGTLSKSMMQSGHSPSSEIHGSSDRIFCQSFDIQSLSKICRFSRSLSEKKSPMLS